MRHLCHIQHKPADCVLTWPQAVQEALQAGDISPAQADAARERYAAIHRHFVQAMAKEKKLLDEAKLLNEELLVGLHNAFCHT